MQPHYGDLGNTLTNGVAEVVDDTLCDSSGNVHITSGSGNDLIYGEGGNDILSGNSGSDLILGGDGNDTLRGDGASVYGEIVVEGNDYLDGGAGDGDGLLQNKNFSVLLNLHQGRHNTNAAWQNGNGQQAMNDEEYGIQRQGVA